MESPVGSSDVGLEAYKVGKDAWQPIPLIKAPPGQGPPEGPCGGSPLLRPPLLPALRPRGGARIRARGHEEQGQADGRPLLLRGPRGPEGRGPGPSCRSRTVHGRKTRGNLRGQDGGVAFRPRARSTCTGSSGGSARRGASTGSRTPRRGRRSPSQPGTGRSTTRGASGS